MSEKKVTVPELGRMKTAGEKITMVTAYDWTFARLLDAQIPKPDLVIYLEARPEILLERIKKRGREFERAIDADYLARLTEAFRSFFYDYSEAPLLVINCSDIDFVEHGGDLADLVKEIRGMKQGVQHYIPLGSR